MDVCNTAKVIDLAQTIPKIRPVDKFLVSIIIEVHSYPEKGILLHKIDREKRKLPCIRVRDERDYNLSSEELGQWAMTIFSAETYNLPIVKMEYLHYVHLKHHNRVIQVYRAIPGIDPFAFVKSNGNFTIIPMDAEIIAKVKKFNPIDRNILLQYTGSLGQKIPVPKDQKDQPVQKAKVIGLLS